MTSLYLQLESMSDSLVGSFNGFVTKFFDGHVQRLGELLEKREAGSKNQSIPLQIGSFLLERCSPGTL